MEIRHNFPLAEILHYKIGGSAKTLIYIRSKEDLVEAFAYMKQHAIQRVLPIGIGANLLMTDSFFDGVVLYFTKGENASIQTENNNVVEAFAGTLLDEVIHYAFSNNLVGLEWAGGLPSTVGGAVRGNVGCFGKEIKDVVEKVEVVDMNDPPYTIQALQNAELAFSYRNSYIKKNKNLIVVTSFFRLQKASKEKVEEAKKVYYGYIAYRKENHPITYPNCGSVFKNITQKENVSKVLSIWNDMEELVEKKWYGKIAMGYVIKRLGFSGFTVGGAEVSTLHSNYIINKNNATFSDVMTIIEKIKEKFFQTFHFYPELEVELAI